MKRFSALLLLLIPFLAQATDTDTLKFWVSFKDKANSPYSVEKPLEYLSEKAIERRKKQNIEITEQDFPVNPNYVEKVLAVGVKKINTSRWLNGMSILTADLDKVKKILKLPFVTSVEKVGVHSRKDNSKMDYLLEFFMSLGGEDGDSTVIDESHYGEGLNQIQMLNGVAMHQKGYTGKGVTIAILDGGFMNVHKLNTFAHLFRDKRIMGTWDFVQLDSNVFDDNNHGMNVLSCIAAKTPGKMVGTAPDANFWLLRTEDANTEYIVEEYNWASGAEFADSAGVDIINSSLGYTNFDDESTNHTFKHLDGKTSVASIAAGIAAKKGIIVCNAAGNEGNDPWKYIGAPADAFGIITVGGVTPDSAHADFSSYGPTADGRIMPIVSAQASKAIVASVNNKFYGSQGTSFATPILCGMVACLRQANPDKSVEEIIDAICFSASQHHKPDTILGHGIPDIVLANRYLGGDKDFDYKKNQLAAEPNRVFKEHINFTSYSKSFDSILITLRNEKGSVVVRESVLPNVKEPKGFHKVNLVVDKKLPKGAYNLEVSVGDTVFKYQLTKD